MKLWLSLFFAFCSWCSPSFATDYYTISGIDPGGVIVDYEARYQALEKTGVTVKIDGMCVSACALVLAFFPENRVCFTERGSFGWHEASRGDDTDPEMTKAFLRVYPDWVLKWIADRGGLTEDPVFMFPEDVKDHIGLCPGSHYSTVDPKKLIKPDSVGEQVMFRPKP